MTDFLVQRATEQVEAVLAGTLHAPQVKAFFDEPTFTVSYVVSDAATKSGTTAPFFTSLPNPPIAMPTAAPSKPRFRQAETRSLRHSRSTDRNGVAACRWSATMPALSLMSLGRTSRWSIAGTNGIRHPEGPRSHFRGLCSRRVEPRSIRATFIKAAHASWLDANRSQFERIDPLIRSNHSLIADAGK